jgi:L-alanine-DL-glutamate epimerase-like enolase superfamily enzyme
MSIASLTAYRVILPLRKRIEHASASREASENVVVRCRLTDGAEGWGEGVPRPYVTGETPEVALRQLAATPLAEQLAGACDDWPDVIRLCERFRPVVDGLDPRGCGSNALRCAVELSILDAFGCRFGEPLSRLTALFEPAAPVRAQHNRVRYSGAITAESPAREIVSALKMQLYRFAQCKLKVGIKSRTDCQSVRQAAQETARLRRIRRVLGRRMDLRLDANEAWPAAEAARHIEPLLACNISCVEQPVPHAEVAALAELRRRLPVKIMLDESLTSLADAQAAIAGQTCDLFNIRLSKCGGFLNSLRLAALAHEAGLGYQLGCHPGESGILSAAGRHWACSVAGIAYLEGSYDRHLLKERLTREDITFGYGGWAPALTGPGLGVTVDAAAVERLAVETRTFSIK